MLQGSDGQLYFSYSVLSKGAATLRETVWQVPLTLSSLDSYKIRVVGTTAGGFVVGVTDAGIKVNSKFVVTTGGGSGGTDENQAALMPGLDTLSLLLLVAAVFWQL